MSQVAEPKTLGEINELLVELRLTAIDRAKAQAITQACKPEFLANLMNLKKAQGRDQAAKSWLSVALSSMSDFVRDTLNNNGLDVALEQRLKYATAKPEIYLQSVKKAKNGDMKDLLNLMNGHQAANTTPSPSTKAVGNTATQGRKSMQNEPTLAGFIDTPETSSQTPARNVQTDLDIPDFDQVAAQNRQQQSTPAPQAQKPATTNVVQHKPVAQQVHKQQAQKPVAQQTQGNRTMNENNTTQSEADREYHSIHFYGGKNAVCLSVDETRAGQPTVRLEGAPAKGQRMYDWTAKIAVQLTVKEMIALLAVFMRRTSEIDFNGHGAGNEKGFSAKVQGDGYYLSVRQANKEGKGGVRGVPVPALDAFEAIGMLTKQILRNVPHLSMDDVWKMMDVFYPVNAVQAPAQTAQPSRGADVRMISNGATPTQESAPSDDEEGLL